MGFLYSFRIQTFFITVLRISCTACKRQEKFPLSEIKGLYELCHPFSPVPAPGGVLPSKRLLAMCRWMGLHFHNWTDYNWVTFLVELLEWGRKFSGFLG